MVKRDKNQKKDVIKKKRRFGIFRTILFIFFLSVFLFSLYKIIEIKWEDIKSKNQFDKLRDQIEEPKKKIHKESIKERLKKLHKENSDLIAWLKIDGTSINYPIMNTKKDPEFYLRRGFNKKYLVSGTPFIGGGIGVDNNSFIIYSHNMKNKTLFGSLEDYKNKSYLRSNRYIKLYTFDEKRKYEIIGAFYTDIESDNSFNYYDYVGNISDEKMNEFINKLNEVTLHDKVDNIKMDLINKKATNTTNEIKKDAEKNIYDMNIIMLSTCSNYAKEGRFVVVGKLIK